MVRWNFFSLFVDQVFNKSLPFAKMKSEILFLYSPMKCDVQADGYKYQEPFAG
jgi:hypothetical protein